MAITVVNTPTFTAHAADATVTLSSHAAGDRIYVVSIWKTYTITASVSGWTERYEGADGTVASAPNAGSVKVGVWWLDAASSSETNPTIDYSVSPNTAIYTHVVLRKASSESWDTPAHTTANMSGTSGAWTAAGDLTVPTSAIVWAWFGWRNDITTVTTNADTIDDDGSPAITWAANFVHPTARLNSTTGDDCTLDAGYRMVGTGDTGVRLVGNSSLSSSETGHLVFVVQGATTTSVTVTPTTAALILTTFAPTVVAPLIVTPDALALVLATFAPTVSIGAAVTVTPTTLALILATFAPTVSVAAAGSGARSFAVVIG